MRTSARLDSEGSRVGDVDRRTRRRSLTGRSSTSRHTNWIAPSACICVERDTRRSAARPVRYATISASPVHRDAGRRDTGYRGGSTPRMPALYAGSDVAPACGFSLDRAVLVWWTSYPEAWAGIAARARILSPHKAHTVTNALSMHCRVLRVTPRPSLSLSDSRTCADRSSSRTSWNNAACTLNRAS